MNISETATALKETAMKLLEKFLISRLSSDNIHDQKCGSLLSYWIVDYIRLLKKEKTINSFLRYKRGDVVKIHLGYRIGSEEGGLHYAVVLNANDSLKSRVLTVVPLTSLKSADQVHHLHYSEVFIGSELLQKMTGKLQDHPDSPLVKEITKLKWGSIALTNQIVTISKLRIYDPVKGSDPLNGIRLGPETIEKIDKKIKTVLFNT